MAPSVSSPPSSPPSSPQLLTTSGYTCSGEFRFQTERCLALVFCRTHIKSRHTLSPSGPVVREGESLTACYAHRHTFETSPAPASSPHEPSFSPPHPWQHTCTALIDMRADERMKSCFHCGATKFITSPCLVHTATPPITLSCCRLCVYG